MDSFKVPMKVVVAELWAFGFEWGLHSLEKSFAYRESFSTSNEFDQGCRSSNVPETLRTLALPPIVLSKLRVWGLSGLEYTSQASCIQKPS